MVRPADLLTLLAAASLALPCSASLVPSQTKAKAAATAAVAEQAMPAERYEVLRVVDGDTIHIRRKGEYEKLRLLSVDTEERMGNGDFQGSTTKPQTVFGEECAVWAIRFFKDLADEDGKTWVGLRFPRDVEARDVYGRLLCHVILPDGGDFNLRLVELGKSPYFNKYGNSEVCHEAFVKAQHEARAEKRGIWSDEANEPKTPGAPAAKRPYDELMAWWDARAQAIDGFRKRSAEHPESVISSEDAGAVLAAAKAKREVELFGSVERTFEESNGDLTVLLRATDKDGAVRVVVPRKLREKVALLVDLEALRREFRQNYLYVRGTVHAARRGPEIEIGSADQLRLAGPEPVQHEVEETAEASAPR